MKKNNFITNQIKTVLIITLMILSLFNCSSKNGFLTDAEIQNDITASVTNYNSDNWETRLNSIKNMAKYSDSVYAKNSMLLVFKAMDDSHSEIRIEALKILKKIKAPAAENKIGIIALNDENSNVRFFAFSALEEYQNVKNEPVFVKGLNDKDWLAKEASLKGLMRINDPGIQVKYINVILDSIRGKNMSIKLTCLLNISIKDPLIYAEIIKIIDNRESNTELLKAALTKIKGYKIDDKTKKRMIDLLTHRDKDVRILSLQALKHQELNIPK